jgi:hypothetical protein
MCVPTEGFVSNPASFPGGGCNPHTSSSTIVDDGQGPFGLQTLHLMARNRLGAKWIHDGNFGVIEYQFGTNPNCVDKNAETAAKNQLNNSLNPRGVDENTVGRKKQNECHGHRRPGKVAPWSKGRLHKSSITEEKS